jgi:hypothetical protein
VFIYQLVLRIVMVAPISGMDLLLEPVDPEDIDVPGSISFSAAGDDDLSVEEWMEAVSKMSDRECLAQWHKQKEYIFEHREEPVPLFDTETVEKSGDKYEVVRKKYMVRTIARY